MIEPDILSSFKVLIHRVKSPAGPSYLPNQCRGTKLNNFFDVMYMLTSYVLKIKKLFQFFFLIHCFADRGTCCPDSKKGNYNAE